MGRRLLRREALVGRLQGRASQRAYNKSGLFSSPQKFSDYLTSWWHSEHLSFWYLSWKVAFYLIDIFTYWHIDCLTVWQPYDVAARTSSLIDNWLQLSKTMLRLYTVYYNFFDRILYGYQPVSVTGGGLADECSVFVEMYGHSTSGWVLWCTLNNPTRVLYLAQFRNRVHSVHTTFFNSPSKNIKLNVEVDVLY